MQILINIPKELMKVIDDIKDESFIIQEIHKVISNGTVIPAGHGRLKDVDAFLSKVKADREHSIYVGSWTADDVLNVLNNSYAPTIIEADNAESEE